MKPHNRIKPLWQLAISPLDHVRADVFQIKENDYITAGYIKKRNFIVLDSLEFCGTTYREVYCIVMDLSGKFMDYAPRFIVGGNILIRGVWKFDLANNSVEPCDIKPTASGDAIHWKFFPRKKSVNTIRLKGVIGKQKVDFLFDTGSRYSKLPLDFKAGPTETVRKESANEDSSLQMVEAELTRNVGFKIGKHEFTHDFFDGQRDCGLLNAYSFGGIAVILNYERRTLEVVYE